MKAKQHNIRLLLAVSKRLLLQHHVYAAIFSVLIALAAASAAAAQDMETVIRINADRPGIVQIEGRFTSSAKRNDKRTLFLTNDHAGVTGLENRISELKLSAGNTTVPFRRIGAGAFIAEREFDSWSYSTDLSVAEKRSGTVHVSRASGSSVVLMLNDLLPILGDRSSATMDLLVPSGWNIITSERASTNGRRNVLDVKNEVIAIGSDWRTLSTSAGATTLAVRGKWHFTDEELSNFTSEIIGHYTKMFGGALPGEKLVILEPMPDGSGFGSWEAGTRGRTVNILLADTAFATQSKQRLHEILRHELFHLWLPNGVDLKGNYAWFYEGAALYASLRAGVELNRIRFDDMLNTLSQAYRIESAATEKLSLLTMSERSWSGIDSRLYARGILIAFICDVEMLSASGGRRSFETLLREIYLKHRFPAAAVPANEAIFNAFGKYPELKPSFASLASGAERMDWEQTIRKAGLAASAGHLAVAPRPNGTQKAILDKLGYNAWRKLIR